VIAVFTKYDQFKREVKMKLEDQQHHGPGTDFDAEVEKHFNEHYLANLGESPPFVRLESEDFLNELACTTLIVDPKKCTSTASGVLSLSKRLPTHSLAESLPSCSWVCRRTIWN
jgi:hypothetical protein